MSPRTHGLKYYATIGCRCRICVSEKRGTALPPGAQQTLKPANRASNKRIPHGTVNGYKHHLCRCLACRFAKAQWSAREWLVRRLIPRLDRSRNREIPHATTNGYTYYRCSCARCKRVWNRFKAPRLGTYAQLRRKHGARADKSSNKAIPHGTPLGYGSRLCSCASCRKANTDRQRKTTA